VGQLRYQIWPINHPFVPPIFTTSFGTGIFRVNAKIYLSDAVRRHPRDGTIFLTPYHCILGCSDAQPTSTPPSTHAICGFPATIYTHTCVVYPGSHWQLVGSAISICSIRQLACLPSWIWGPRSRNSKVEESGAREFSPGMGVLEVGSKTIGMPS
jgi:hypothetical protein